MEIDENDYILAMWFHAIPEGDALYTLVTDASARAVAAGDTVHWRLHYRFRYYSPDGTPDPFDGRDRKSHHVLTCDATAADVAASVRRSITTAMQINGWAEPVDEVDVHGDAQAMFAALRTRPWAHFSTVEATSYDASNPRAQA